MKPSLSLFGALLCVVLLAGCSNLPRDQRGWTSQIQREHILTVGVASPDSAAKPIHDAEKQVVEKLAERLGARVQWKQGNTHTLLEDLEHGRLPLVAAQLPNDSPFAETVGMSQPLYTRETDGHQYSIAVAPGENRLHLLLDQVIGEYKNAKQGGESP